jgi:hypothetical protein
MRQEATEELSQLAKSIERSQATLARLRTTKTNYNPRVVIERNEAELARFQHEHAALENKLLHMESDAYRDIVQAELDQNRETIAQKSAQTQKRKAAAKAPTAAAPPPFYSSRPKSTGNRPFQHHSNNVFSDRDFAYAEKQYHRDSASLPDHLYEKLQNMPSHMGYIWKDIWFFGSRCSSEPIHEYTLFEKRNQQFLVHVYNHQTLQYNLYEKDANGRRRFIERRALTPRTRSASIAQLLERRP